MTDNDLKLLIHNVHLAPEKRQLWLNALPYFTADQKKELSQILLKHAQEEKELADRQKQRLEDLMQKWHSSVK
jgi:hypothetical protein